MTPPHTITAAQFQALCELHWGDNWRHHAAESFRVSLRNVQFWAAEPPARSKPIPAGVVRELWASVKFGMTAPGARERLRSDISRRLDQLWILELVTAPETPAHPADR